MDGQAIASIILFAGVGLLLFALIARVAVADGTKELTDHAKLQSRLLVELCRKQGVQEDLLQELVQKSLDGSKGSKPKTKHT